MSGIIQYFASLAIFAFCYFRLLSPFPHLFANYTFLTIGTLSLQLMKQPKSVYQKIRLPLAVLFLGVLAFFIFRKGDNQERFELGRQKYAKAEEAFERGNYASAVALLEEVIELGYDPAKGLMGEAYLKIHNYKAAKHFLKDALNVERAERFKADYYGWVNYNLGTVYYLERNGNIAYKYYKLSHDLGYPPAAEYVKLLARKEDRLPKL